MKAGITRRMGGQVATRRFVRCPARTVFFFVPLAQRARVAWYTARDHRRRRIPAYALVRYSHLCSACACCVPTAFSLLQSRLVRNQPYDEAVDLSSDGSLDDSVDTAVAGSQRSPAHSGPPGASRAHGMPICKFTVHAVPPVVQRRRRKGKLVNMGFFVERFFVCVWVLRCVRGLRGGG
jgi:hypothetical protein